MLDLYVNVRNALDGLTTALRVAVSNANNFNTPGYKYTYASFASVFSQVLNQGSEKTNPEVIPGSMTIGSMATDYSQGNLAFGTGLDAAIVGEGLFILSKSATDFSSGADKVYSRSGRFQVDYNHQYLTDSFGRKVYGYKVSSDGTVQDKTLVPIDISSESDVGFVDGGLLVGNFQARKDAVAASEANPPAYKPLYRLALTTFPNKQGLSIGEGSAYSKTISSGEPSSYGIAGENKFGDILGERVESSNINVARVAMDMNLLNRGFAAVQGILENVNKVFTQTISKIG